MQVEIDELDFDIEIHRNIFDKRKLTIKQIDSKTDPMLFYIALDGYNLVNFWRDGDVTINTGDYTGRDYKYSLSSHNGDEVRYKLVPSEGMI